MFSSLHRVIGTALLGGLLFCLAVSTQAGERFARDRVLLPFAPAAMAEGPSALRYNPAALGTQRGMGITYFHSYSDSSFEGDDALYLSTEHLGFGIEWLGSHDGMVDGRAHKIGLSTGEEGDLMVGSSYEWRSSDDPAQNKSHFWSQSLLWRPNDWLSMAAVADNHNRMKHGDGSRSDAEFTYSAAVNLLDGRLKVGGDWYQTTSQRVADGAWRVAAAFEMTDGVTLFADIDEDENYFLGGRLDATNLFAGSQAGFDKSDGYRGGVFYAGYRQARRRTITTVRREVVHLTLTGAVPDRRPPRRLFGANPPTTYDWVSLLERAGEDQAVRAVVLTIADPHLGWARITELRHAVTRLRARGKYVVAYLEGTIGNGEYYLATAADEIIVPPVATIDFIGLRAEVTFVKRLLDKIGVTADLEHIGDYKSASDLLTRTEMSPEHREAVDQLLDDFDQALRLGVATGRAASLARIDEWIDHGPYVSIDAVTAGLIDRVAYADEVDDIVRAAAGPINTRIKAPELAHRLYHNRHWGALPRVAVVFAEGTIAGGRDREALGLGKVMGAETISNAIRRAREDRDVVAIVLRVNSGGGSVFASDKIWREVERTVGQKPIVVSFGDIAASGGYYIAATADSIFALPNTVTGSIGIISGKFDMSALHDKIGMDKETVTRGRFADLGTSTRAYSDEERAVVVDQMQRGYERFIGLVAEGRSLPVDSVDALGRGRVWSGTAALAAGLVDRHADLHEVITVAARMAGVRSGRTVRVEVLPRSGWELFDFGAPGLLAAFSGRGLAGLVEGLAVHTGLGFGGDPAYRVPFTLTIE